MANAEASVLSHMRRVGSEKVKIEAEVNLALRVLKANCCSTPQTKGTSFFVNDVRSLDTVVKLAMNYQ